MKQYYVYTLAYPDGTVFYVGKGTGNRINHHEQDTRKGKQSRKYDIIRQIWRDGGQVLKARLKTGLTEDEALLLEYQTIQQYDKSQLANERFDVYVSNSENESIIRQCFGDVLADMTYKRR